MSKPQDRTIYKRDDGKWVNKRNDTSRASSLHDTQKGAVDAGKQMLGNQGGGELTIKAENGRFRSKDTISPGNDTCPPRDNEH